ncbi:hypothetical protein AM24_149 [Acinetobacter phage AM24]|nr:hypothetical protein AM24_149 [Acinetobacter phage AM24]
MKFQVGDKVVITKVTVTDIRFGVKVGDVAKVVEQGDWDPNWYYCRNPDWKQDTVNMKNDQIKKL